MALAIRQSINQSTDQSINQSITTHSINQSVVSVSQLIRQKPDSQTINFNATVIIHQTVA